MVGDVDIDGLLSRPRKKILAIGCPIWPKQPNSTDSYLCYDHYYPSKNICYDHYYFSKKSYDHYLSSQIMTEMKKANTYTGEIKCYTEDSGMHL